MRTKKTTITRTRIPSESQLLTQIEKLLEGGSMTMQQIATATKLSVFAIRPRLAQLVQERRAHRLRIVGIGKWNYLWMRGPAPILPTAGAEPRQAIVRSYPDVGRRDDLVAALFGVPRECRP